MNNRKQDINILSLMEDRYAGMSKSHKAIARFIREHYDQAVFMTAARMGEQLGISESTVVRFASGLGFKGYPEFQEELANWVKNKLNSIQRIGAKYGGSSKQEVIEAVLQADMEKIHDTMANLDTDAFDAAVTMVLEAKTVYIVGIRSCQPLAEFLAFYLNMVRDNVKVLNTTSTSEIFEQMIRVGNEDAVIGISFPRYSMRTLKAMEFANDRNAGVISITDNVHSPMCLYSSCNLFARSDMVSIVDSLVAPLSLINALIVAICLRQPDEIRTNLETLEKTWNNYQVYLNDEIDFIKDTPILDYSLKREE
ncbi:MAG: MurR/RpiR family transcriptional regulator [Lachnospiraceae bacterium]